MKEKFVTVNYLNSKGEENTQKGEILYIGHTWEYVETKVFRGIDSGYIEVAGQVPLQIVVFVVRILATGEVIQVKPSGVKYDPIAVPVK